MKKYTTKEVSDILSVSTRTIQRHIATILDELANHDRKGISMPEDVFNLIKNRVLSDSQTTDERQASDKRATDERHTNDTKNNEFEGMVEEWFTQEEHDKLMSLINTEYPVMKKQIEMSDENLQIQIDYIKTLEKQIEYFQFSYNKQLQIHEKLIESFRERNFIEAKEKGYDKN